MVWYCNSVRNGLQTLSLGMLLTFVIWGISLPVTAAERDGAAPPKILSYTEGDLQDFVDQAPPYSVILCNRNRELVLSSPVVVRKPLELRGLKAKLPPKLGKTPLVIVDSDNVTLSGFNLHGNAGTVDRSKRSALIEVRGSQFVIQNGELHDSTKDGVMISPGGRNPRIISGGVVRNIAGSNIDRDLVSISATHAGTLPVEHLLVENIRCHGSPLRGAVEVSNGSRYITVRKVFAENCVYAVDVQDHNEPAQINHDVLIEDVHAKKCQYVVRFLQHPFGHHDITLRDLTAVQCSQPLVLANADRLTVSNVRINGFEGDCPLTITNCDGVFLRDVMLSKVKSKSRAIQVENCNDVLINGVIHQGNVSGLKAMVLFRLSEEANFSGLDVGNILAAGFKGPLVAVQNDSKNGKLIANHLERELSIPVFSEIKD